MSRPGAATESTGSALHRVLLSSHEIDNAAPDMQGRLPAPQPMFRPSSVRQARFTPSEKEDEMTIRRRFIPIVLVVGTTTGALMAPVMASAAPTKTCSTSTSSTSNNNG